MTFILRYGTLPRVQRDRASHVLEDVMKPATAVRSLEDCIRYHNLFLVHAGHCWSMMRVTGEDSVADGAIPLPELNRRFAKAAMINTIVRIGDVPTLQKYMDAARIPRDELIKLMNQPLHESGYEEVFGV